MNKTNKLAYEKLNKQKEKNKREDTKNRHTQI